MFSYFKGLLSIDRFEMFRARIWKIILHLDNSVVFYGLSICVRLRVEYFLSSFYGGLLTTCNHSSRSEFVFYERNASVNLWPLALELEETTNFKVCRTPVHLALNDAL